jgi:hypothetical protein
MAGAQDLRFLGSGTDNDLFLLTFLLTISSGSGSILDNRITISVDLSVLLVSGALLNLIATFFLFLTFGCSISIDRSGSTPKLVL